MTARRHLLPLLVIASLLPAVSRAQAPARSAIVARIDSLANAVVAAPVAGLSIAVVKGRDTLVMKGYGRARLEPAEPVTAATIHRTGSVTKQFTSAAILQFVDAGKLRLDDTLAALLPQAPVPAHWRGVTLRQLLNHTSGIPSYTDVPRFRPFLEGKLERDTLFSVLRGDSLMFAPGGGFYYNNTGYYLLGLVVERLSGKPYAQHVQERLFAPLGMRSTLYCPNEPAAGHAAGYDVAAGALAPTRPLDMGGPYAAGAICSSVGDLVTWTRALASGKVVSRASYDAMTTPVAVRTPRRMTYGFALTSDTAGTHRVVQHGGNINGFAAHLAHYPDDSLVVAVLANTSGAPAARLADNIARAVLGLPLQSGTPQFADLPTTPEERVLYAGKYAMAMPDGARRDVTIEDANGQLMVRLGGGTPARLQRQREHVFAVPGPGGGRFLFDVQGGRVLGFVLDRGARPLPATRVN
jgi:D-alanyl-D-alanine carboxypeptidase